MNLCIEFFTSKDVNRDKEYKYCLSSNVKAEVFKTINIFISDDTEISTISPNVKIVKLSDRPSYKELFEYCNKNFNNEVCIIANTDIIFDDTVNYLNTITKNDFVALTRWDIVPYNGQYAMRLFDDPWAGNVVMDNMIQSPAIRTSEFSQDAWAFKTPIKVDNNSDFLMGKPGCDNRISCVLNNLGYEVKNPSLQIITKHLHITNYRTYNQSETIPGPYLLVSVTNDITKTSDKKIIQGFA